MSDFIHLNTQGRKKDFNQGGRIFIYKICLGQYKYKYTDTSIDKKKQQIKKILGTLFKGSLNISMIFKKHKIIVLSFTSQRRVVCLLFMKELRLLIVCC